jgi:L-malate glycosyltransferase
MKILVLCHEYPPIGGGGGIGAKQYAEAWAEKGQEVMVLTSWRNNLSYRERVNGVQILRFFTFGNKDRATSSLISMFSYLFVGFFFILFNLREFRSYHVLNAHFSIPAGILGVVTSKLLRIPSVLTIIGGDIFDPTKRNSPHRSSLIRRLNAWVINTSDKVVAISSDTKHRAEKYYALQNPIQVLNYGFIPLEQTGKPMPKRERANGKFSLISVGRLVPRKGFEYLIRSLELLPEDIHLLLVGDGPLERELKVLAAPYGDRIEFAGYKPREEIIGLLRGADCYVLPSLHEGLGIVIQEAMYAGLPIVCTNNGGQTDLVKEPRNGILVEPENIEMLSEAIKKFYLDRELAKATGINNQEDIQEHYMATNSETYMEFFKELLQDRKVRQARGTMAAITSKKQD